MVKLAPQFLHTGHDFVIFSSSPLGRVLLPHDKVYQSYCVRCLILHNLPQQNLNLTHCLTTNHGLDPNFKNVAVYPYLIFKLSHLPVLVSIILGQIMGQISILIVEINSLGLISQDQTPHTVRFVDFVRGAYHPLRRGKKQNLKDNHQKGLHAKNSSPSSKNVTVHTYPLHTNLPTPATQSQPNAHILFINTQPNSNCHNKNIFCGYLQDIYGI